MRKGLARKFDPGQLEEGTASSEKPRGFIAGDAFRKLSKERVLTCLIGPPEGTYDHDQAYDEPNGDTVPLRMHGTPPILWVSSKPVRQSYFISLQKWEGVVLDVCEDSFLARLVDLEQQGPDEEAEILLDELSADDLPLVNPGAVFYWHIGYHVDRSGQRKRASIIRFRRLPMWTAKEIETATREAERTRDLLGWT
jgi:hypothetical protein